MSWAQWRKKETYLLALFSDSPGHLYLHAPLSYQKGKEECVSMQDLLSTFF